MTGGRGRSSARTSPSSAASGASSDRADGSWDESELGAYLGELTRRLDAVHGLDLVGVYVGGSYALGGYEPPRSDVDVAAVARRRVSAKTKRRVVAAIRHEALPCPARVLELVLYPLEAVTVPSVASGFDLNLNTGRDLPLRVDVQPVRGDDHWFAIDRSVLQRHGVVLAGPPASEVFAPIPRTLLLPLIVESLRRQRRGGVRADDAVLNACRALRFAAEDAWSTKVAGGRWALGRVRDDSIIRAALDARAPFRELDQAGVDRFVSTVIDVVGRNQHAAARSRR